MAARIGAAALMSALLAQAQTPTLTTTSYSAIPTLASALNAAPTLIANIDDPTAPDSQKVCSGYKASNVKNTTSGLTADLQLAGPACNTYGTDIEQLSLLVEYQAKQRLHVQIIPTYLAPENRSHFFLPEYITGYPSVEDHDDNDLVFSYKNEPTFQFQVSRKSNDEVIFSTYGHQLVYQNQFLELATSMVEDYNVYGLAENTHDFRLGNNYTNVYWNADAGNTVDYNAYGTHPFYLETRYDKEANTSSSHGVYARNAHGQEWLLRSDNITYRTLGGAFDFYFVSGPTPKEAISQYQSGIVGLPTMFPYWVYGFHQCRWGYQNWSVLQDVIDNYRHAGIQLESVWNDIDYMNQYRDFTNGALNYPVDLGQEFLARLHANNQHYIPIIDSNIYAPDPQNASDSYSTFSRGQAMNAFIRNGDQGLYYGDNWPGFSVWTDWLVPQGQEFWTNEIVEYHKSIPFDGIWIDLSEASSFCDGSCGTGELTVNPAHPPFLLPGDPGMIDYTYPESFNITNATEAASASMASASQASSKSATMTSTSATSTPFMRTVPTPGVRNLNFPPYVINNVQAGHALGKSAISPNATHNDQYNSTEYDFHNVWGHQILNATRNALASVFPGQRPFILGRSQFAGSGKYAAHWGGDNTSKWGSMFLSISQSLTFAIAGMPMFGADTCGFTSNSDYELCTRWMELSAFFPFYRNHNVIAAISQEAYVWASTAAATRVVMNIRYSLLPYMNTLFYEAHTKGETVMRALQWEFPTEEYLKAVDNQFMLGPSILVTPVLEPLVDYVKGVFPGVANGTIWYDWYTLAVEDVAPQENKTLAAPLEHINVHIKGGSILPLQQPGYTTEESRRNPYDLLIALDKDGGATGNLYLDDGISLHPNATKEISMQFKANKLTANVTGTYIDKNPLANLTVAGLSQEPKGVTLNGQGCSGENSTQMTFDKGVLRLSGLAPLTKDGVWSQKQLVVKFEY